MVKHRMSLQSEEMYEARVNLCQTLSQISRCGWRMDVINHRMVLVHGPSRICGPKAVDGPPWVLDLDDLGWEEGVF